MHKVIDRLARVMAMAGGVVLVLLVVLICVSVLGRGLNTLGYSDWLIGLAPGLANALVKTGIGPITGDFEILEAGIAFAIFAFLPMTQLLGAHATVDVFTSGLGARANAVLRAFWEVILTVVILLITWRLYFGFEGKYAYGETTFLLQFPIWWAYGASLLAALVASVVGIYCAAARVGEALTDRSILPREKGPVE